LGSLGIAELGKSRHGLSTSRLFPQWRPSERTVVAAVCYRIRPDGNLEFLLVRTKAGRWTFPKGGVERDPSFAAAAAREAYEEAGVVGRVHRSCLARYRHRKNGRGDHMVHAHLCEVMHVGPAAEVHRFPTWFSAEKAKRRLREDRPEPLGEELERVVDAAVRHLAGYERSSRSR
jgi:8-oxo-dGTP pyrophosphatase MutT (NUDIX family)